MKKLLSLLLVLCMCFAASTLLISCDTEDESVKSAAHEDEDEDQDESTENDENEATASVPDHQGQDDSQAPSGSLEEAWNAAIQPSGFENVTFTLNATFVEGYGDPDEPIRQVMKFDGDTMSTDGHVETDAEGVPTTRMWLLGSILPMMNDFDKFTYDDATQSYSAGEELVYTATVNDCEATITASDVQVFFDSDMRIAKIVCRMIQEGTVDGESIRYVLDVEFSFTDYGTTMVE